MAILFATALTGLVVEGCSASAPDAKAPTKSQDAGSVEATAQPAPGPDMSVSSSGKDLATEEQNLETAEKALGFALDNKTAQGTPLDAGTDRCTVVCKALTSMRESAKHVCSLAADRCDSANDRVKKAEDRAKGGCPVCATPT